MVHKGNGVQIIYGPKVTVIKSNLEEYLENAPEEAEVLQTIDSGMEEKKDETTKETKEKEDCKDTFYCESGFWTGSSTGDGA